MKQIVSTKWKKGMTFESDVTGFKIVMDAKPEVGGQNQGPNPKPLLLSALTGCTGMDVASLMKKMRQDVTDFQIEASAQMTVEHPKHYDAIHLVYKFAGNNLHKAKLKKAVDLSMERYCGISYMLSQSSKLTYKIVIE